MVALAAALTPPAQVTGQTITETIDSSGDGAGNGLNGPTDIAVGPTFALGVAGGRT